MGYGRDEQEVFALYQDSNDTETFFKLKPKLTSQQIKLVNSFYRLCSERQHSNGPLPLAESVIERFALTNGTHGYPIDLYISAITEIDNLWLDHQAKKMKKALK